RGGAAATGAGLQGGAGRPQRGARPCRPPVVRHAAGPARDGRGLHAATPDPSPAGGRAPGGGRGTGRRGDRARTRANARRSRGAADRRRRRRRAGRRARQEVRDRDGTHAHRRLHPGYGRQRPARRISSRPSSRGRQDRGLHRRLDRDDERAYRRRAARGVRLAMILSTVEMHTGGEPTRIIVDGWPRFVGKTLLDKRREAKEQVDHLRRSLMPEPRGHDGMYGALLVEPDHPDADLAVLFMHVKGYSTLCGHATIALARWAVESGRVKGPTVRLQCPCGLVIAKVAADGSVRFESVPSFAYAFDRVAPTATWGPVTVDLAYGG